MALNIRELSTTLATLTISGVTVCDLNSMPSDSQIKRSPQLYPEPVSFVQDMTVIRDSFHDPSVARKTATYVLRYTLAYCEAGDGRSLPDKYPGMVSLAADVLDALIGFDDINQGIDAIVNIEPSIPGGFGVVFSPAGTAFLGTTIYIRVTEFIN